MKPEISFPKQNKPRRVNPTCRSGRFRSDFVGIRRNPMKSGSDLVGFQSCSVKFRQNSRRNPTEGNPTKLCRIRSKFFRSDGIRSPFSHMGKYPLPSSSILKTEQLCSVLGMRLSIP
jgi:hypothetical protein